MIENLVDAWLTDASERSYEAAFSQLLLIEGHRVIQGPLHHSHEHGKDIITEDPDGELCAFQLKGGASKLDLDGMRALQDQLFQASVTAVDHPRLAKPRRPDRVFLVTNQKSTGPAQSLIRRISDGNVEQDLAPVQLVEKDELVSRFVDGQGRYFPSAPSALRDFLSLFLATGVGPLPRSEFFSLLEAILPVDGKRPRAADAQRAISAGALTTAFALHPWIEKENHAEIALGWFSYCSQILRVVERIGLGEQRWSMSFDLAQEEARRRLRLLLKESFEEPDLLVGHPAEPLVYSIRATQVCGLASALVVSERIEFGNPPSEAGAVGDLIMRERDKMKAHGEVQAPNFFLAILALSMAGKYMEGTRMLFSWIASLAESNAPNSSGAVPDPYHSPKSILMSRLDPGSLEFAGEDFAGNAYTLHVGIRWAARRLWRQSLAARWRQVTRVQMFSFEPKYPIEYLYPESPNGTLRSWYYPQPTSWFALLEAARDHDFRSLPGALLTRPEYVPFYCLALPHRFNTVVSDLLDHLAYGGRVSGLS